MENVKIFNVKKSPDDARDYVYQPKQKISIKKMPVKVDLTSKLGVKPYNQYDIGSCTANATAAAIQFLQKLGGLKKVMPSRLFIYYNSRAIAGMENEDSGAYLRDVVKAINKQGYVAEKDYTYTRKNLFAKPSDEIYKAAASNVIAGYERIEDGNVTKMMACLAEGYPFVFGMVVYNQSYSIAEKTGVMPMPKKNDDVIGGHAVIAVGYDSDRKAFIVRNSYGTSWGNKGYFLLPFDFADNPKLMWDCWVLKQ